MRHPVRLPMPAIFWYAALTLPSVWLMMCSMFP